MTKVYLEGLKNKLTDKKIKAALSGVGEYLLLETDNCFREERAPDGQKWAPLKMSPKKLYKRRFGRLPKPKQEDNYKMRRKILTDTGRLRGSITYQINGNQLRVGTNVIYARTHNQGDPSRSIPKREFLGLTQARINKIKQIIINELTS